VSHGAIEEMWFEEEGGGMCCRGPGAVTVPGEMGGSRMVAGYRSLNGRSGGQWMRLWELCAKTIMA
jgi:hypothetical protein